MNGQYDLMLADRSYDITFPCKEDIVCFRVWQINTRVTNKYIAIVSNGQIQRTQSEEDKCTLQMQIKDLTVEDAELHQCQRMPNDLHSYNSEYYRV